GQHMAQMAVTGKPAAPMPARISAWAIYDVFDTKDGQQVFVGVVSDSLWEKFCATFGLEELAANPEFKANNQRVLARDKLMPQVRELLRQFTRDELIDKLEHTGIPFAPIGRPEDMFDDPHLLASGGLADVTLPDGRSAKLPTLPIEMNGERVSQGATLARIGQHTREILAGLGMSAPDIDALAADKVVELG
ncbi:MAG TPA: CoA transferase, partial [Steroidobacteraceae bacterium]|nr:CoA transferase [Steroidobacteraceae bacterium]